jgi:sulfate transport system ATP-binding protein
VEEISFRGDSLELKVRVKDALLTANYSLEKEAPHAGEKVGVLIRRIYVFDGNEARLLENENLKGNFVSI